MKKQGMAVPIVLIFATIMGFVAIFLLRNTRDSNAQTQTSMEQLQSYFIARAGVEHAMIKVKYLNRELYDAMCMQQGRNPLFDYSQIKDGDEEKPWEAISQWNPGPIFLYPESEKSSRLIKGVNSNMSGTTVASSTWINVFKSDLVSKENPIPSNSILDIDDAKKEIESLLPGYVPFVSGEYYVPEIRVSASKVKKNKDDKLDNNLVIEFTVKSNFVSAKNQAFDYEIKRTIKVSRD